MTAPAPVRARVVLRNPKSSKHHRGHGHGHGRGGGPVSSGSARLRGAWLERRELIALVASCILFLYAVTSLVIHSVLVRSTPGGSADLDPLGVDGYEPDDGGDNSEGGEDPGWERLDGRDEERKKKKRNRGGGGKNRIDDDGTDLDASYPRIRAEYDAKFPSDDRERMIEFARSLRKREYVPIEGESMPYDVNDCPSAPPEGYPMAWPVLDVLENWNPDDATPRARIYQGLCRFDAATEYDKALTYRKAELPFVIRDDPVVLPTVERWNQPEYLTRILGRTATYRSDYAETNHLMFFRTKNLKRVPEGWKEPTTERDISYPDWLEKARRADEEEWEPDHPHWYFRLNGKSRDGRGYLFEELPFFRPRENFYMIDPTDARGINCRFGMRGNTAENHFDGSRNFIALFGGERRYFLSHPGQCPNLALYPARHPSGRHSAVNWADPDLERYPQFERALVNEVVLQGGDVLYLPTNWFHHIVSLNTNFQCNARSGMTDHYLSEIRECGFKA
uniref:JmjC domain-containing protein n=1 Tax=Odontella aurita TaxID=265563 RepID=A0A7S4J512_9STRA